jgi:hypothetical protein
MDKNERNRIMDEMLEPGRFFSHDTSASAFFQAIRECDRLARAWDELENAISRGGVFTKGYLLEELQRLLNPTPKDPLEELYQEVKRLARWPLGESELMVGVDPLLEIIRRLGRKK